MIEKNKKQILKNRAEKLAIPIEKLANTSDFMEVVVFSLADEKYAIETQYIEEVYPLKEYTVLPCVPPFIFGLTNVRRKIMLIINLKVLFSIPASELDAEQKLVILGKHDASFALLTDGFTGIQNISKERMQSSLPTFTGIREDFLKGIMGDGTVVLDGQKLLKSKQLILNEIVD